MSFSFCISHSPNLSLYFALFTGMALCDMFTLLCPAPGLIYMLTFGHHNQPISSIPACYAWVAFYEVSSIEWILGGGGGWSEWLFPVTCHSLSSPSPDNSEYVSYGLYLVDIGTGSAEVSNTQSSDRVQGNSIDRVGWWGLREEGGTELGNRERLSESIEWNVHFHLALTCGGGFEFTFYGQLTTTFHSRGIPIVTNGWGGD